MPTTINESDVRICGTVIQNPNETISFPDSKLQTLDRRVGKDKLYFDKDLFAQSVEDWSGIPIIYQPQGIHPDDFAGVKNNPAKTAEAIGGKLVGYVSNPHIVTEGGARLMASLNINEKGALKNKILAEWHEGKLRPSTAFQTKSDGDRILTPPIPNHVLLFPEKLDVVQAGDYGAYVNTMEISPMTEPKTETIIDETPMVEQMQANKKLSFYEWIEQTINKILDKKSENACGDGGSKKKNSEEVESETKQEEVIESMPVADAEVKPAETAEVVAETNSVETVAEEVKEDTNAPVECAQSEPVEEVKDDVVASEEIKSENAIVSDVDVIKQELESVKNSMTAEIDSLKSELAKYKEQETEQKFTRLLNAVPVGMKQTDEQKNELREKFNNDLEGLLFTVLEATNNTANETKAVGSKFMFSESTGMNDKYTTVGDLSQK